MLTLGKIALQSALFELEYIPDLLYLLGLDSLQLHSYLLPHLHCLPPRNAPVMQDVYICRPFIFQIPLQLLAPVSQEVVTALQHLVCLFLQGQLLLSFVH